MFLEASALPLISAQQEKGPSAAYATGAMVVAETLVALDRFSGFTNCLDSFTGNSEIHSCLATQISLDWDSQEIARAADGPTENQVKYALTLARGHIVSVDAAVPMLSRSGLNATKNKIDGA
ncbi:MAG: hypothetical protein VXZ82_08255 [Planctomycetota bacterium]|nr:hypothetical protein [Planctomycetota bacterium]